jgi:hypothetical protein
MGQAAPGRTLQRLRPSARTWELGMTSMLKMVGERRASWREGGKVGLPASFRRRQGVERRSHVQDVAMHACMHFLRVLREMLSVAGRQEHRRNIKKRRKEMR